MRLLFHVVGVINKINVKGDYINIKLL